MAVAFAAPDLTETAFLMQGPAGFVPGEYMRLQCPIACRFGEINQTG